MNANQNIDLIKKLLPSMTNLLAVKSKHFFTLCKGIKEMVLHETDHKTQRSSVSSKCDTVTKHPFVPTISPTIVGTDRLSDKRCGLPGEYLEMTEQWASCSRHSIHIHSDTAAIEAKNYMENDKE